MFSTITNAFRSVLVNRSGGLRYHLLARKHQNSLWTDFICGIDEWLNTWQDTKPRIIIFGASGGYLLSHFFLERFEKIICVDPDPLAEKIFRFRHSQFADRIEWLREDVIGPENTSTNKDNAQWDISKLTNFMQKYPEHSFLFSNILGQLGVIYPHQIYQGADIKDVLREDFVQFKKDFEKLMQDKSWASFHDRLSADKFPSRSKGILQRPEIVPYMSNQELIEKYYHTSRVGAFEVVDHLTGDWFVDSWRTALWWRITEDRYHLIEAIHS